MLKSLLKSVAVFSILLFATSIVVASSIISSQNKKFKNTSDNTKLIVVKKDENKNIKNISTTKDSYSDKSGFDKDYDILDKQVIRQSSIARRHSYAVGKVYIPKSFEEASRLAELKHGVKKNKSNSKRVNLTSGDLVTSSKLSDTSKNKEGISFLASVIYHSNGKSDLSPADLKALEEVAKFVKLKSANVLVVGHASSRTGDMSMLNHKLVNYDISVKRANRIKDELIKNGLSSDIIYLSAVSDTEPIKNEVMPLSESINRRSEIYISY